MSMPHSQPPAYITLEPVLTFIGCVYAAFLLATLIDHQHPKRLANSLFYGILASSFLFGTHLDDFHTGLLALGLIGVGGLWGLGRSKAPDVDPQRLETKALKHGNGLFLPALIVPLIAIMGVTFFKAQPWGSGLLVETKSASLIWLYLGIGLGLFIAMVMYRPPLFTPITEGVRLMDTVGWAAILPQMLAALGTVFAVCGVGDQVGKVFATYLPLDTPWIALCVFALGMAIFTMIMGNAFAAFPVMMAAIGLPLIVGRFHGDVVALSAIGMLSGFCGTLLTPMAANFNLVPSALLELKDRYGVIKAQAPTALVLFGFNLALMALVVFR